MAMPMVMASSQHSSSSSSLISSTIDAISLVKIPGLLTLRPKLSADCIMRKHVQGLISRNNMSAYTEVEQLSMDIVSNILPLAEREQTLALKKMYVLFEAVSVSYEMHPNIGEQRVNWNSLLFNSVNMMTLTAMAQVALVGAACPDTSEAVATKVLSAVLFSAATRILMVVSKIKLPQLTEDQPNASRLFKQLQYEIMTFIATESSIRENNIHEFTRRVLAPDIANSLSLLVAMIEKLPSKFSLAARYRTSTKETVGSPSLKRKCVPCSKS